MSSRLPRFFPRIVLILIVLGLWDCLVAPPRAHSDVEFSLGPYIELHTLAPGRIPLWPNWSQDAQRICFTATDVDLMQGRSWLSEIWVMDVDNAPQATRLLNESMGATCHSLSFVPNDSAILFQDDIAGEYGGRPSLLDPHVPNVERRLGIEPRILDPTIDAGAIFHSHIRQTPNGCRLVLDMEKTRSSGTTSYETCSVYLIPTDPSGNPDLGAKVEVFDDVPDVSPFRLSLSPSGNELLFSCRTPGHSKPDVRLITGLDRIVTGQDLPIRSISDSRFKTFVDGPYHADAPSWSEDGSLIFYGYDFDGRFVMSEMNFDEANFDIMVVRLADALSGNLMPTRLVLPGNTGCLCASRGGTRFVFAQTGTPGHKVCATGFEVSLDVPISEGCPEECGGLYITQEPFGLSDGSGTTVRLSPHTMLCNYEPGPLSTRIAISTPVAEMPQIVLPARTYGMPVQRAVRHHSGSDAAMVNPLPLEFEPPAEFELAYTDAEIRGLNENDLLVYAYDPNTGRFDQFLPLLAHDIANNRITVSLSGVAPADEPAKAIGAYAEGSLAAGVADTDGDGLADGREVRWDGDLTLDVYDPLSNPGGTDLNPWNPDTDGDGSPDGQEASFGTDPLDPSGLPEFPAAGMAGLAVLTAALALALARKMVQAFS